LRFPLPEGNLPRLALVWFFCLGGLGLFFPFYSLYLHENAGLTGTQVGRVLAILPLIGIFAQPLWGQIADRTGSRSRVLAVLALGAALGYATLALPRSFAAIALATAALAFFSTALLPMGVSVTLALTRGTGPHGFGLARVWGTVGFMIVVVSFPYALHAYQETRGLTAVPGGPSEPGLQVMFPVTALLVAVGGLVAITLPRGGALSLRAPRGDWRRLLRHGPYRRVLLFVLLAYACIHGPMTFFPVFVRAQGGTLDSVSHMWIPMLLLEIPLIALSGASLQRVGARGLLAIGVLAGGLRWVVCGFAPDLSWVYPVQLLHGVVVAGLVLGGPLYVEAVVPERLRSTGQGVLAMIGVSLGGISSNLGAGWLLEHVGASAPFVVGGLGALALGALLPVLLPAPRRAPAQPDEAPQESIARS
jgi:PPP family 3-phenylpropionic acid transporter